ncbi:acyltransferase family protein [Eudoraea chungangensis]|uniref:acyltransferase family protein n=1 Tax=Eudoraea chungangensis TaxID=1481905 RepID=UPI0023ECB9B4|nr:acyltransferase [Eudoraea chungangensis]
MRIDSLDYLRGLMAIAIMFYHYFVWTFGIYGSDTLLGKIGLYGVSIFYVLSGLTLYLVYENKLSLTNLFYYFKKRIYRIFPLLWICVFLNILLLTNTYTTTKVLLNLSGLFGFIAVDQYIPTGAWSIGNELVFYAFFPVVLLLSKRLKFLQELFFISSVLVATYFAFGPLSAKNTIGEAWKLYINPFNQLFLFSGGILMGKYAIGRKNSLLGFLLLVLGLGLLFFGPGKGDLIDLIISWKRFLYAGVSFILPLAFLLINYSFKGFFGRILLKFGYISYSIYLIHPIIYWYLVKFIEKEDSPMMLVVISLTLTLIVSYYIYILIEAPFIKLGKNLSLKKDGIRNLKAKSFYWLIPIVAIIILQLNKRNADVQGQAREIQLQKETNSPYVKLLNQLPVYRDSVYKIYIAEINSKNKIIFMRDGLLSDQQKNSKFFIHIYPKDTTLLPGQIKHFALDFHNKVTELSYKGETYFISDQELPSYIIYKLNAGQYGYNGDNSINWQIEDLIMGKKIGKVLSENRESMSIFEYQRDTF